MKAILILNVLLLFGFIGISQSYPYEPIYFTNLSPLWQHVSTDSTTIDIDSENYDGTNHFSIFEKFPSPHIVRDNYLYIGYNTSVFVSREPEGGFIEKIDLNNGQSMWRFVFDLRHCDHQEFIETIFFDKNESIKVVSYKNIKPTYPEDYDNSLATLYGDTSLICIRTIDPESGELLNIVSSEPSDEASLRLRFSVNNRTILTPLSNGLFQYTEYDGWNSQYQLSIIDELGHIQGEVKNDSIVFEPYEVSDWIGQEHELKMFRVSEDSLLTLDYIYDVFDPSFVEKQTKLTLYDKNMEKLWVAKIDSIINTDFSKLYLSHADEQFIYLVGRIQDFDVFTFNDTLFYSILNWDGELIKQFTTVYNGEKLLPFRMVYLKKEDEFLLSSLSKNKDALVFFKTTSTGIIDEIDRFYFTNPSSQDFSPWHDLLQLENGDILMKGHNNSKDEDGIVREERPTWLRIRAEDLDLTTNTDKVVLDKNNKLNVYPNPLRDYLSIYFPFRCNNQYCIEIFNNLGLKVFNHCFEGNFEKLNISHINSGYYFVKLSDLSANKTYNTKIIKI